MTKEKLTEVLNMVLEKPRGYYFVCYGGSSVKMVDTRSHEPNFKCQYQGDKNWMTPLCEKCQGLTATQMTLTDRQESFNSGAGRLYAALLRELDSD
jgi:hypothetical protein